MHRVRYTSYAKDRTYLQKGILMHNKENSSQLRALLQFHRGVIVWAKRVWQNTPGCLTSLIKGLHLHYSQCVSPSVPLRWGFWEAYRCTFLCCPPRPAYHSFYWWNWWVTFKAGKENCQERMSWFTMCMVIRDYYCYSITPTLCFNDHCIVSW